MNKIIIDVREPYEFTTGHVKGAINIPPDKLMSGAKKLDGTPKDSEIIVYCRTGSRSHVAKIILDRLGYTNVTNGINKDIVNARYL
ncbi:MAG: rhodanese-like domain-containing protein [Candidatus Saccharimonadales bacterium]